MEKHCESVKRFGKEGNSPSASMELLRDFIRDSGDKAYGVAYNLTGNAEDAKELVQEAMYRVVKNWHRYDAAKPLGAWVLTVLRNAWLDKRRRYESHYVMSESFMVADNGASWWEALPDKTRDMTESSIASEDFRITRKALNALPEDSKAVLSLCDMYGLKYEQAAWELGVSIGTIYLGTEGQLVGCGNRNRLLAINPDGTLKWQILSTSNLGEFTSPTIGPDGTVYAVDNSSGNLLAVNPDSGIIKFQVNLPQLVNSPTATPAIGADGTIYVVGGQGGASPKRPCGLYRGGLGQRRCD